MRNKITLLLIARYIHIKKRFYLKTHYLSKTQYITIQCNDARHFLIALTKPLIHYNLLNNESQNLCPTENY